MKVFHRSMQTKLSNVFPEAESLPKTQLECGWAGDMPALVVIHRKDDAQLALNAWKAEINERRLSILVVSSEGFGGRRDLPSGGDPCVHWLSWGIPNQAHGGASPWQERKMQRFLEYVESLEQNPPDWTLLELPEMPKHLLAGYVLSKAEIEGREELLGRWEGKAVAEFEDLQREESRLATGFSWEEATIEDVLKRCGWLDDA